ncbi:MAG TPA: molybdate ABC transporter substrate-binding protein [Roseiflexaceae bacterium]
MRRASWLLILVSLLIALNACGASQAAIPAATSSTSANNAAATTAAPAGQTTELNVFAAASLTDAFNEIGKNFEAGNPGTKVIFNFAGSQQLSQQIGQGAPADVFASANKKQMDVVIQSGQVISGTQRTFVRNRLVVIYPRDNPAKLNTLKDLAKPDVKLVLAAKDVPVGGYALDFLARASKLPDYTEAYSPTVLANVKSYEENVKAVLSKIALGEADAGIVYASDIALDSADKVGRLDIPDVLNTIAAYPIATIKDSQHADMAKKFVEYVLSPAAQQILVKYGFIAV